MKKNTYYFNILFILVVGALIIGFIQPDRNYTDSKLRIQENLKGNKLFELVAAGKMMTPLKDYHLFTPSASESNAKVLNEFVRTSAFMTISREQLKQINSEKSKNISITIPQADGKNVELELTRVNIIDKDFKMVDARTGEKHSYLGTPGLYYQGVIKGNNNSIAGLSVFDNFVMGLVSDVSGTYVLGSVKDNSHNYTENYVYYNDKDLLHHIPFVCGLEGKEDKYVLPNKNNSVILPPGDNSELYQDTVGVYLETDNQMYIDNNNNEGNVYNYVTGFFNFVTMLYRNESIPMKISGVGYWQTADPYANMNASDQILLTFGENKKDNFMGDLAHLLSTGHQQQLGGIAWINVLCVPATQISGGYHGRFAFSNIENTYQPYPTYSWTVTVVTHEMGHNLGSHHTHACHWDLSPIGGGLGPLDTCIVTSENSSSQSGGCINAPPANSCYQPDNPLISGFIMSYCHFCVQQGGGINFLNGFGRPFNTMWSQSGDTIRMRVQQASCIHSNLNSSEVPNVFMLAQNFPNPFNPTTTIRFALPQEGFVTLRVYDITGREVTQLISSKYYPVGLFTFEFDSERLNLASGVYLYKLDVTSDAKNIYSQIRKMVLVK